MTRVLVIVIAGVVLVLTGCGEDEPAMITLAGTVMANTVDGGCPAGQLRVEPAGGEAVTVALESGRPPVVDVCVYAFEAEVARAEQYRFTIPGADRPILRSAEGEALDSLRLDFR